MVKFLQTINSLIVFFLNQLTMGITDTHGTTTGTDMNLGMEEATIIVTVTEAKIFIKIITQDFIKDMATKEKKDLGIKKD